MSQEAEKGVSGKATLMDFYPTGNKKRSEKQVEDNAAYPKSSGESGGAFATGAIPAGKRLSPENEKPVSRWVVFKQHTRRYWFYYVPLAIVALAVALIIIFLVILPAIVQRVVDNAALPVQSAMLMYPAPNQVAFSLVSTLSLPGGLAATVDPINLSLSGTIDKTPYAYVQLPKQHLKGTSVISITNQTADITDLDSFTSFLRSVTYTKNFTLSVYGKTTAHLGKLKSSITLRKEILLPGLQNLTGFSLSTAKVVLPAQSDGTNLLGTAIIPNYSKVAFQLGNVTLNMMIGGLRVGGASLQDVFLQPGNNTLPLRAAINLTTVIQNLQPILASQSTALKNGDLSVQASGNTSIYDGKHLEYYEDVFAALLITTNIPIKMVLQDSLGGLNLTNNSNPIIARIGQLIANLTDGNG